MTRLIFPTVAQSLKFIEAEHVLKRILAIDEKLFGPKHPNVAYALNNLAGNNREWDKHKEAEALLKRALVILEEAYGKDQPIVGNILEHYARLLHKMDRSVEAAELEKRYQTNFAE